MTNDEQAREIVNQWAADGRDRYTADFTLTASIAVALDDAVARERKKIRAALQEWARANGADLVDAHEALAILDISARKETAK